MPPKKSRLYHNKKSKAYLERMARYQNKEEESETGVFETIQEHQTENVESNTTVEEHNSHLVDPLRKQGTKRIVGSSVRMPPKKRRLCYKKKSKAYFARMQIAHMRDLQNKLKELLDEKKQSEEGGTGNLESIERQINEVQQQINEELAAKANEKPAIGNHYNISTINSITTENIDEPCLSTHRAAVRYVMVDKAAFENSANRPTCDLDVSIKIENTSDTPTFEQESNSTNISSHISDDASLQRLPAGTDAIQNPESPVIQFVNHSSAEENTENGTTSFKNLYNEVLTLISHGQFKLYICMHAIDRETNCIKFYSLTSGCEVALEKAVTMTKDVEFKVSACGMQVPSKHKLVKKLKSLKTAHNLKMALNDIFCATICPGVTEEKYTEMANERNLSIRGLDSFNALKCVHNGQISVKSKLCFVLFEGRLCPECVKARNTLRRRLKRRSAVDDNRDLTSQYVPNSRLTPAEMMMKLKQYRNLVEHLKSRNCKLEKRNQQLQMLCFAECDSETPIVQLASSKGEEGYRETDTSPGFISPVTKTRNNDENEVLERSVVNSELATSTVSLNHVQQRQKLYRKLVGFYNKAPNGTVFAKSHLRDGCKFARKRKTSTNQTKEKVFPHAAFYRRMRRIRDELSVAKRDEDHSYNGNVKGFANPSKNRVCLDSISNNPVISHLSQDHSGPAENLHVDVINM